MPTFETGEVDGLSAISHDGEGPVVFDVLLRALLSAVGRQRALIVTCARAHCSTQQHFSTLG